MAGNCDLTFDIERLAHFLPRIQHFSQQLSQPLSVPAASVKPSFLADLGSVTYLEDSATTWNGIKIWGSPYTPEFNDWGFPIRQSEAPARWASVPDDADVLVMHSPPRGVCDLTSTGAHVGCPELRKVVERIKPALIVFGHIHEAFGVGSIGDTLCANVAVLGPQLKPQNPPTYIDLVKK